MSEKLLLEIIIVLLGALLALIGFLFKSHFDQHKTLEMALADVKGQRVECSTSFASKESVVRAHSRLDEQQSEIGELSTRVARLEGANHEL